MSSAQFIGVDIHEPAAVPKFLNFNRNTTLQTEKREKALAAWSQPGRRGPAGQLLFFHNKHLSFADRD